MINKEYRRFCLLFFVSFLISSFVHADTSVRIDNETKIYYLNPHIKVYLTLDTLSGGEAYRLISDGELEEVDMQANPGLRNPESGFWLLFTIENISTDHNLFFLELSYPQLDYVELFTVDNQNVINQYVTGDIFRFDQRPVSHHNFIFPVSIPEGKSRTFLLNAEKRRSVTRFPLSIYPESVFQKKNVRESVFYGAYFGILSIIIALSLLVGIFLRRQVFIWYGLYITGFGLWLFSRLGFTYEFLLGDYPRLNQHFLPVMTQFAIMMLILYVQSYFNTQKTLPVFHKVMSGIFVFFCLGYLSWALKPDLFIQKAPGLFTLRYILTATVVIFAFVAAFKSIRSKPFRSKIFLAGYSTLLLAIIAKIGGEYGAIDESGWILDPIMLGFLIEVLVLSIAMVSILLGLIRHREELLDKNQKLQQSIAQLKSRDNKEAEYMVLKSKALIPYRDIIYIKSDEHYLNIYLADRNFPEVERQSLSSMKEQLPDHFIQIHRSYIVNLDYVKSVSASQLELNDGTELTISRKYKGDVKKLTGI